MFSSMTFHVICGYFVGLIIGCGLTLFLCKRAFDEFVKDLPTRAELREMFELDPE